MNGLLSNLTSISPFLSTLIELAYQTGLLLLAFWLGKLAMKGYRRDMNTLLELVISIGLGFLIYLTSKPVVRLIPINIPFLNDLVALIIPVLIFYISFLLIFERLKEEYASAAASKRTERLVNIMAEKLENLKKGSSIGELGFSFFKDQVKSKMEEVGAKEYEIKARKRKNDHYIIRTSSHKAIYELVFNVYSGRLVNFNQNLFSLKKRVKEIGPYLLNQKKKLAGVLVIVIFLLYSLISYPSGIRGFTENLKNLSFGARGSIPTEGGTGGCIGPIDIYQLGNKGEVKMNVTEDQVDKWINEGQKANTSLTKLTNQTFTYKNDHYVLAQTLINNTDHICSINLDKQKSCSCISSEEIMK